MNQERAFTRACPTPEPRLADRLRNAKREAYQGAILDAAEDVFETEGYVGATMSAVADHAGTAVGTLYNYFPNKQALVHAIRARLRRRYAHELQPALAEPDRRERLGKAVLETLRFVEMHGALMAVGRQLHGEARDAQAGQQLAWIMGSIVADGQRSGLLDDAHDPEQLTVLLCGMLQASLRAWLVAERSYPLTSYAGVIVTTFLRGAQARGEG